MCCPFCLRLFKIKKCFLCLCFFDFVVGPLNKLPHHPTPLPPVALLAQVLVCAFALTVRPDSGFCGPIAVVCIAVHGGCHEEMVCLSLLIHCRSRGLRMEAEAQVPKVMTLTTSRGSETNAALSQGSVTVMLAANSGQEPSSREHLSKSVHFFEQGTADMRDQKFHSEPDHFLHKGNANMQDQKFDTSGHIRQGSEGISRESTEAGTSSDKDCRR